jgi:hypothetical protein
MPHVRSKANRLFRHRGRISLALASRGLCHGVFARFADVGEMRLYANLYSAAAWFHVRPDLFDVITASFSNCCSFNQNDLARRREIVEM